MTGDLSNIEQGKTLDRTSASPSSNDTTLPAPIEPEARPRTLTFGNIEVTEDFDNTLVSSEEMAIYQEGFDRLQILTASVSQHPTGIRGIETMVFTNPRIMSGIIGIHPMVHLAPGEAELLYQAATRAGIEIDNNYTFFDAVFALKNYNGGLFLLNNKEAEHILRTYQKELGIQIDQDQPLTAETLTAVVVKLLSQQDIRASHIAYGLLSGIPLEECRQWVNVDNLSPHAFSQVRSILNPKDQLPRPGVRAFSRFGKIDPIPLLEPEKYDLSISDNQYFPDMRATTRPNNATVEGLGLTWQTSNPPREASIRQCQKLLEVDRNLRQTSGEHGLLGWLHRQQNSVNAKDSMKLIGLKKTFSIQHKVTSIVRAFSGKSAGK